jgi:hypothetical protein
MSISKQENNVSEIGYVTVLRREGGDTYYIGSLRKN